MKWLSRALALVALIVVGVCTWVWGSMLSADAIGMAVGLFFGVMASIPTALLIVARNERQADLPDYPVELVNVDTGVAVVVIMREQIEEKPTAIEKVVQ